jgi:hypothetical protein
MAEMYRKRNAPINSIRVNKSKRVRWAGRKEKWGCVKNGCRKTSRAGTTSGTKPRLIYGNIKRYVRDIWRAGVDWIELPQHGDQWRVQNHAPHTWLRIHNGRNWAFKNKVLPVHLFGYMWCNDSCQCTLQSLDWELATISVQIRPKSLGFGTGTAPAACKADIWAKPNGKFLFPSSLGVAKSESHERRWLSWCCHGFIHSSKPMSVPWNPLWRLTSDVIS